MSLERWSCLTLCVALQAIQRGYIARRMGFPLSTASPHNQGELTAGPNLR
jgi:hypothetical protein